MLPFKIHDSWIIIALLAGYQLMQYTFPLNVPELVPVTSLIGSITFPLCLFFSVLCHEGGHRIAAWYLKIIVPYRIIFPFGTVYSVHPDPKPGKIAIFFLAGPFASLLCALSSYATALFFFKSDTIVFIILEKIAYVNVLLAGTTLLPLLPLDGGAFMFWSFNRLLLKPSSVLNIVVRVSYFFSYCILLSSIIFIFKGYFFTGLWTIIIGKTAIEAIRHYTTEFENKNYQQPKTIRDFVEINTVMVPVTTSVYDFVHLFMYQYGSRVFPVISSTYLEGYVDLNKIVTVPHEAWKTTDILSIVKIAGDTEIMLYDTPVIDAINRMFLNNSSHLLVSDYDNNFFGILLMQDLLCAIDT